MSQYRVESGILENGHVRCFEADEYDRKPFNIILFSKLQSVVVPQAAAREQPHVIAAQEEESESSRSRLFVIDDEATIRAAIQRFLSRRGWEVEEAEDGRMGLERLLHSAPGQYDVIMCDMRMPRCSGIDLHDVLLKSRPDLVDRLIFSTGDVASVESASFFSATQCPVIEKPFELLALEGALERIRDRHHNAVGQADDS